jgi:hypothetical protein
LPIRIPATIEPHRVSKGQKQPGDSTPSEIDHNHSNQTKTAMFEPSSGTVMPTSAQILAVWLESNRFAAAIRSFRPGGSYEVTKRFPERNGQFEYRIKGAHEPHERVATEDELRADDV